MDEQELSSLNDGLSRLTHSQLLDKARTLDMNRRTAWKAYYNIIKRFVLITDRVRQLPDCPEQPSEEHLDFIRKEYIRLKALNKELSDCPVCFEAINEASAFVGYCGHVICRECQEKLPTKECPICKRRFKR